MDPCGIESLTERYRNFLDWIWESNNQEGLWQWKSPEAHQPIRGSPLIAPVISSPSSPINTIEPLVIELIAAVTGPIRKSDANTSSTILVFTTWSTITTYFLYHYIILYKRTKSTSIIKNHVETEIQKTQICSEKTNSRKFINYVLQSRVIRLKFSKTRFPSNVWLTSGCHWSP